jgi:hypothetical protein
MSIHIDNLTEEQVEMLDIMWSFEMLDELEEWQATLSLRRRRMSEQLMSLVLIESLDQVLAEQKEFPEVKALLSKFC